MSGPQWLEAVVKELSRRGLPRQEVARLADELSDHLSDRLESRLADAGRDEGKGEISSLISCQEFTMRTEASVLEELGHPTEIADAAALEYGKRPILHRSRLAAFLTFVVLPLPALVLGWIAAMMLLAGIGNVLGGSETDSDTVREVTWPMVLGVNLLLAAILVAPATGIVALFSRLARRTRHQWRWGLAACLLIALTTALAYSSAEFSELPGRSKIMFGMGISGKLPSTAQIGQFLLPMIVGLLILRRSSKTRLTDPSDRHSDSEEPLAGTLGMPDRAAA
ncbi:MAG: HAAS signaling domain-containing protein [Planctomycetales bacterium]